jgi:hypothetical protein
MTQSGPANPKMKAMSFYRKAFRLDLPGRREDQMCDLVGLGY